ncbi:MAG: PAS domain S-box protein [Deltaproteobacteria bacterium]|nr:PAS domain S-box protein [Deltaproteobacteria bacterium]
MRKKISLIKFIRLWGIIVILASCGSIVVIDIVTSHRDFDFRADQMRTDYVERQKLMVKREVDRVVDMIYHKRLQNKALAAGTNGFEIKADPHGDDLNAQIKVDLLETISRIRFGKEGYIFVNRFNGDALVSNGKLVSGTKKLWDVFNKNPDKIKRIFKKEYDAALTPSGDYIYYSIIKLTNPIKESPKVSFIYGIPDLKWIVGAGVYLDDVETGISLMQTRLNNQIKAKMIRFFTIALGIIVFSLFLLNWFHRRLENDFNLFLTFFNQAALSDDSIDRGRVQFDELDRMAKNANRMLLDRRQAEDALRRSEEKFRGLVESSSDWIWEVNDEAIYTYASPRVEAILGFTPDEIVGKTPFDLMPPEEGKRIAAFLADVKEKGGSIIALENVNLHKDGRRIILETSGVPFFDKGGKVIGYRGVDRDITGRKQAEEALRNMEKLKSIGTLAGGIAHDFNNIMTGLFGNISIARQALPKNHKAFQSLEQAEGSMNRAIHLTSQLLTFARGGAPVKENVSLDSLAEEVVCFDLSGSNVKPVFKHAGDLWPVEVDTGQIQQVFSNLAINARQAMPDGGHLYITLENADNVNNALQGLDPGKYIMITMTDEGTGIDRKYLNRIFDPYFTTKHAGNGLGLATVYSIINRHGGCINVDSTLGSGTTFTFYLPASEVRQPLEKLQAKAKRTSGDQSARILVMDDEEMIREVVTSMLEISGYSAESAEDGKQAITMYKASMDAGNPFDVVIMDLTIPGGVGGLEAIRDLLEIDPKAKCIVSSGYADDPVMANYAEYGFYGIVTKPYTQNDLREALNRVLRKS